MFDKLTQRFEQTWKNIRGHQLTAQNIRETLAEIRTALLDADVALPVVDDLLTHIEKQAVGQSTIQTLTPAHTLLRIVYDEFVSLLGSTQQKLNILGQPPITMLMAGLQGSGKTTTVGKLAYYLTHQEKKSVLVVSVDVYRPGAIEQLEQVISQTGAQFFKSDASQKPLDIAKAALNYAQHHYIDIVLIDSAGRLHIDTEMMAEIKQLHQAINPKETLFVVDSMTGQDAANTARAFNEALALTGVILTKVDGDARGGAALSVRQITGKPIKFIGVGEKVEALEVFHPERIASRILGQGDLMTLAEEAKRHMQPQDVEKMAGKIKKGQFTLVDFRDQIKQMQKMGGLANLMSKMPGMSQFNTMLSDHANDRSLLQIVAIIDSMTPKERSHIELLLPPSDRRLPTALKNSRSRIQRVANGSGTDPQMVKRTLKQFSQMQKMMKNQGGLMKQLSSRMGGGMGGSMPNIPGLSGLSGLPDLSNMAGKMPDLEKLFKNKG